MSVTTASPPQIEDRVLIHRQDASGPTLICVAGLHGNEPAGVEGLRRVLARIEQIDLPLTGTFLGVIGNQQALAAGRRFLSEDLNRVWLPERLAALEAGELPLDAELAEQLELHLLLEDALAAAPGRIYLLDLHTTSGPGPAFAVLDDTLSNRDFAMHLPVPLVLGIEEELDGTLASYLLTRGVIATGFECGQHEDPASADRAEAAIWIALEAAGLLPPGSLPEVDQARGRLLAETPGLPRVVETRYRHAIEPGEGYRTKAGFVSFQPVTAGEIISLDGSEPVRAPESGRILMPLYQRQGEDGFFIVRDVNPAWLRLSSVLRRIGSERLLHWLPGVTRKPGSRDSFVVDRRVARWYALELLHLLGFRRHGQLGERIEVSRRRTPRRPRGG